MPNEIFRLPLLFTLIAPDIVFTGYCVRTCLPRHDPVHFSSRELACRLPYILLGPTHSYFSFTVSGSVITKIIIHISFLFTVLWAAWGCHFTFQIETVRGCSWDTGCLACCLTGRLQKSLFDADLFLKEVPLLAMLGFIPQMPVYCREVTDFVVWWRAVGAEGFGDGLLVDQSWCIWLMRRTPSLFLPRRSPSKTPMYWLGSSWLLALVPYCRLCFRWCSGAVSGQAAAWVRNFLLSS